MSDAPGDRKEEEKPKLGGMTVNERLVVLGLIGSFDAAARSRDRQAMIELLRRAEVRTPEQSVDTILADPKRYGF